MDRKIAKLWIEAPGSMSQRERRDIAKWLKKQADDLLSKGPDYTDGRYTASFTYTD